MGPMLTTPMDEAKLLFRMLRISVHHTSTVLVNIHDVIFAR